MIPLADLILALLCVVSGGVHALGARIIWRSGLRVAAPFFAISGVVQVAFAVALIRNGAPARAMMTMAGARGAPTAATCRKILDCQLASSAC